MFGDRQHAIEIMVLQRLGMLGQSRQSIGFAGELGGLELRQPVLFRLLQLGQVPVEGGQFPLAGLG
jgi:hypothetical protein